MVTKADRGGKQTSIERPLGGTEKIYWLLDKLYSLNFAAYVELDGKLDPTDLQTALASVQEETPLLRTRIVLDGKVPVFEPVAAQQHPLQAETRSLQGWRRQLEKQLDAPFALNQAPLARFLWFRDKTSKSVVAMVFHHPIADGRSGVNVLLDVLRRATGTGLPFCYRAARPSVQDLDFIRQQHPVRGKLKEIRFWLEKGKDVLSFASQLPGYDASPSVRRESRSITLVIPRTRSAELLSTCRAQQTSVHGALGAAQVLALNEEFNVEKPRVMALNSLADLREVIDGNLSERDLGLYISTLTTVHAIDADPDFWRLAREIRDRLKQIITSGDGNLIHSFYPEKSFFTPDKRGARMVQNVVALAPPSSMLTNIGRIDHVPLGHQLELRGLGFLLSPPAQYPICVTAASYDGRMILNLLYDHSKITRQQAERICGNIARNIDTAVTRA